MNDIEPLIQYLAGHGEKKQALSLLKTLEKHSWQFEEYDNLAKAFFKIKLYEDAMRVGEAALSTAYTNERMYAARSNLINVYNHANHPEKAMRLIKMNELVIPNDSGTRLEKSFSYFLLNDRRNAEKILIEELERGDLDEETKTKILFNLGTYCMWRDEFQKGLGLFLHEGQKLDYWRKAKLPYTFWDGQDIPEGSTMLLYAEAGIGDEIINVRFMRHLRERNINPIWITDRADMIEIFNKNGYPSTSDWKQYAGKGNIYWTYPMSLPVYLGLEYKDLWNGPYLNALTGYHTYVPGELTDGKKKIGLRWQGNPEYDHDLHRSVPLEQIMETVDFSGASLLSLQRDSGLEELDPYRDRVWDMTPWMTSFMHTMDVISKLDVVITSCTSIAHAAAAMGKTTYIFVPISAYYTWSHATEKSPWYGDNVTLLRQVKPRDWTEPINQLKELLKV